MQRLTTLLDKTFDDEMCVNAYEDFNMMRGVQLQSRTAYRLYPISKECLVILTYLNIGLHKYQENWKKDSFSGYRIFTSGDRYFTIMFNQITLAAYLICDKKFNGDKELAEELLEIVEVKDGITTLVNFYGLSLSNIKNKGINTLLCYTLVSGILTDDCTNDTGMLDSNELVRGPHDYYFEDENVQLALLFNDCKFTARLHLNKEEKTMLVVITGNAHIEPVYDTYYDTIMGYMSKTGNTDMFDIIKEYDRLVQLCSKKSYIKEVADLIKNDLS